MKTTNELFAEKLEKICKLNGLIVDKDEANSELDIVYYEFTKYTLDGCVQLEFYEFEGKPCISLSFIARSNDIDIVYSSFDYTNDEELNSEIEEFVYELEEKGIAVKSIKKKLIIIQEIIEEAGLELDTFLTINIDLDE